MMNPRRRRLISRRVEPMIKKRIQSRVILVVTLMAVWGAAGDCAWADGPVPGAPAATPAAPKITDEVVLAFFKKYEPEVYSQLMVLKDKNKTQYETMMQEFYKEVGRLLDLQHRNEGLFNMTMEDRRIGFEALQLARTMQQGKLSGPELERSSRELETLVSRQFDVRQRIRQAALDEQKARIEDLKKHLEDIQK